MIHDPEEREDTTPRQKPKPYVPLESRTGRDAMPKAVPMPPALRAAVFGGRPAPEASAPPPTAEAVQARQRYERGWQAIQREIGRQKGAAAVAFLAETNKQSVIAKAAGLRGWELDEEFGRLAALYRKGAPLALRGFPPLGVPAAGASLEREERVRAKEPLFAPPPEDFGEFVI